MKYQGLWSRWHRFDDNGVKYIQKFGIDEVPSPLHEQGYTQWARGTGPLNPEHRKNVANALRKMCLGKPKSAEQKKKMSEAKKGKPKSQAHKDAMRETWKKKRQAKYQQAMQTLNNINSQRQVA